MAGGEPESMAPEVPAFVRDGGMVEQAYELAAAAHEGQERKGDGSPYISHPVGVARLCREVGSDDAVVAAALLHDVIEDTDIGPAEIESRFGAAVRELVVALTEDEAIRDYGHRKSAHRKQVEAAGARAATIYIADKLANLRDMRELYAQIGERAAERFTARLDLRIALWEDDAEMVATLAPTLELPIEFQRELEAFREERAAAQRRT